MDCEPVPPRPNPCSSTVILRLKLDGLRMGGGGRIEEEGLGTEEEGVRVEEGLRIGEGGVRIEEEGQRTEEEGVRVEED